MRTDLVDVGQRGALATPEAIQDMGRLRAAAQEFEAAMISAWWQSMQESFSGDGSENDGGGLGSESGVLQDLSRQTMSSAIAEAGGLGFSGLVLKQLGVAGGAASKVPGRPADL